jgi:hypothetical protein
LTYPAPDNSGYLLFVLCGVYDQPAFGFTGGQLEIALSYPVVKGELFLLKAVSPAALLAGKPCPGGYIEEDGQVGL